MKFRVGRVSCSFSTADSIRPGIEGSLSLREPLVVNELRVFSSDRLSGASSGDHPQPITPVEFISRHL